MAIVDPIQGEVCSQFIRCGKDGCRCQKGVLHGPYYYRIWREGSKVHKAYVKASDVQAVRAQCEAYKALQTQLRQMRQGRQELAQRITQEWRQTKRLMRAHSARGSSA